MRVSSLTNLLATKNTYFFNKTSMPAPKHKMAKKISVYPQETSVNQEATHVWQYCRMANYVGYPSGSGAGRIAYITCPDGCWMDSRHCL